MNWNDDAFDTIVEKYPALEGKPESVALAVWALKQNKDMTPDDWRALAKKTRVKVAGRAIGSARQIVGMQPKIAKTGGASKAGKGRRGKKSSGSISDVLESFRDLERERDTAVATLQKIRNMIDSAI